MVEVPEVVEGCAGKELVRIPLHGDGVPVGGEAVVIVVLETMERARFVGDQQAAIFEDLKLLGAIFWGFIAAHARGASRKEQRADLGIVKRPGAYCWGEYRHISRGSQETMSQFWVFSRPPDWTDFALRSAIYDNL